MCFVRSLCPSPSLRSLLIHEGLSSLSLKQRQARAGSCAPSPGSVRDREEIFIFLILCKPETLLAALCFSGKWREKGRAVTEDSLPAEGRAH